MVRRRHWTVLAFGALLTLAGCHTDMWRQKRVNPQAESRFFADGAAARPLVPGTVARGQARLDEGRETGFVDGRLVDGLPATLTLEGKLVDTRIELRKVLMRGKERYNIFCSHCHGAAGDGDGMITRRGLNLRRPPATFHTDRLRQMPLGYFYDVITNGYGTMFSQAPRVGVDDRWAIVAYIRALQASQNARRDDLDADQLRQLQEAVDP
jgi:hypothetical protein